MRSWHWECHCSSTHALPNDKPQERFIYPLVTEPAMGTKQQSKKTGPESPVFTKAANPAMYLD